MTLKSEDVSILERKFSIYLLLEIEKNPGRSKLDVISSESTGLRTKTVRINELIEAGLIYVENGKRFNADNLFLTKKGKDITTKLKKIRYILLNENYENDE